MTTAANPRNARSAFASFATSFLGFILLIQSVDVAHGAVTLGLSPKTGPEETRVTVEGMGFCSGPECSPVEIWFAGKLVTRSYQISPEGAFGHVFNVPEGASAGRTEVRANQTGKSGEKITAAAMFEVTAPKADGGPPEGVATSSGAAPGGAVGAAPAEAANSEAPGADSPADRASGDPAQPEAEAEPGPDEKGAPSPGLIGIDMLLLAGAYWLILRTRELKRASARSQT